MSDFIFPARSIAGLHQQKQTALLVSRSTKAIPMTVRDVRRRVVTHDEDGNVTGFRTEQVRVQKGDDHSTVLRMTILAAEDIDVMGSMAMTFAPYRALTQQDAKACGQKTVTALRDDWRARHPRNDFAKLVWFALGDVRDRDIYMGWTGRAGGDYVSSRGRAMDPDAPVLTPEQYQALGRVARQKDAARDLKAQEMLRNASLTERARTIERYGEEMKIEVHNALERVMSRVKRAENRLTNK